MTSSNFKSIQIIKAISLTALLGFHGVVLASVALADSSSQQWPFPAVVTPENPVVSETAVSEIALAANSTSDNGQAVASTSAQAQSQAVQAQNTQQTSTQNSAQVQTQSQPIEALKMNQIPAQTKNTANASQEERLKTEAKRLPTKSKERVHYKVNAVNYISYYDVSVLEFPVAVANVVQPLEQEVLFTSLNENKTLAVTVNTAYNNSVQLVVSLVNGKTMSLQFELKDITGSVYIIPRDLAGNDETETLESWKGFQKEGATHYNDLIITIMRPIVMNDTPDESWNLIAREGARDTSPFREFSATDYHAWTRDLLMLQRWKLCQRGSNPVQLEESQFVQDRNTLAVTLTQQNLGKDECGLLIVLTALESRDEFSSGLQPYMSSQLINR